MAFALFAFGMVITRCKPAETPEAKELAAEGAYAADHMKCIESFNNDPEINACRAKVRARWGIVETVRDAGGDR